MPDYEITSPDGKKFIVTAPDGATQDQVLEYAQSQFSQQKPAEISDIPEAWDGVNRDNQIIKPNQPSPSFLERAKAVGEAGLAIGTGATTGLIGQAAGAIGGIGKSIVEGTYGTQEGARAAEKYAADVGASATYSPRSKLAQEYLGNVAQVAEPLAGLAPFTQELNIIGQSARAASPVASAALKNELDLIRPSTPNKQVDLINKIRSGSTENELAKYRLEVKDPNLKDSSGKLRPEAYKVVDDPVAKIAISQEWEPGTIQSAKNFDAKTADVAQRMLDIAEKGSRDDTFKASNRPIAELGGEIARQFDYVRKVNREAGASIKEAAVKLKSAQVDVNPAVDRFMANLESDLGVTIVPGEKGVRVDFKGSDIEGNTPELRSVQGVIKNLVNRMSATSAKTAYDAHKLKGYIDTQASYGSSLGGLKGKSDRVVKGLRHDIDSILDDNFPEYREANEKYAQTKQALDSLQELAGKKIDLQSDSAPQVLGRLSRRLLSNAQTAERVREAALNINDIAANYGAPRSGDIPALVKFADTLDKQFSIAADTSLAGEVAKGVTQSKREAAINVGSALYQKVKGVNNAKKYNSMKNLLERQKKQQTQNEGEK